MLFSSFSPNTSSGILFSIHKIEAAKVAVRNIRRDANDAFKKLKGSDVSEDTIKELEEQTQKLTDKYIKEVDKAIEEKSKEIMTV